MKVAKRRKGVGEKRVAVGTTTNEGRFVEIHSFERSTRVGQGREIRTDFFSPFEIIMMVDHNNHIL